MSIFGDLFGGDQIDAALEDLLATWMPTYLKEVVRQRGGLGGLTLAPPGSIRAVAEFDRWPEQQLPAIVIVNPGTGDPPINRGGAFDAKWPIEICISVSAASETETRRNSQLYIAAARGCIMQRRSLGAGMKGVDWSGESYTLVESDKRRSLAGAKASFVIEREDVLTVGAGPIDPELDPQPEGWPVVTDVEAEVEKTN
jgi:hypothetical protein